MPYVRGYEEDGFLKKLNISRQTLEILTPDKVFQQNLEVHNKVSTIAKGN